MVLKIIDAVTQTFECENCGGILKFNIAKQIFACGSCMAEKDLQVDDPVNGQHCFDHYIEREKTTVPFDGVTSILCQRCGMEIVFTEKQIATTCPMCDSTQVTPAKQHSGVPPDGIVPFKVDRFDAQQMFKNWVKSRWFAPNDFKSKFVEGNLNGMYLPFWVYDAHVAIRYSGRGGTAREVRGQDGKTQTTVDWKPVSGNFNVSFNGIQVCASKNKDFIKGILPYDTNHYILPFSTGYLSGYYAEIYEFKANTAFNEARRIMDAQLHKKVETEIKKNYTVADIKGLNATYSGITYSHILLPLWESAFGYAGKTYRYLVNGETGKVSGKRPYCMTKISIALVAAIILFFLLWGGVLYGLVWSR